MVDRTTIRAYVAYGWAEVIRHARTQLVYNCPGVTPEEAKLLGLPVLMEWIDENGSQGYLAGILVAVEPDGDHRWAVTDDGLGADMNAAEFTMRMVSPDGIPAG